MSDDTAVSDILEVCRASLSRLTLIKPIELQPEYAAASDTASPDMEEVILYTYFFVLVCAAVMRRSSTYCDITFKNLIYSKFLHFNVSSLLFYV